MITTSEQSLKDFEFWSGACDTVKYLSDDEIDTIELLLKDVYPEGMSETEINDFFWFDDDVIAEWIGYSSFEKIIQERGDSCD